MSALIMGSIVMAKLSDMSGKRGQRVAWIMLACVATATQAVLVLS